MRWLDRQEVAGSMTPGGEKRQWQPVTVRRKGGQKQACVGPRLCHTPLEAKLREATLQERPRPGTGRAPGEARGRQWTWYCSEMRSNTVPARRWASQHQHMPQVTVRSDWFLETGTCHSQVKTTGNVEKLERICLVDFSVDYKMTKWGLWAPMNRNRRQEADLSIFALFNRINILFI